MKRYTTSPAARPWWLAARRLASRRARAVILAAAALAGLALPSIGLIGAASATPSPWEHGSGQWGEVTEDTCDVPGLTVQLAGSGDFRFRFVTRAQDGLPYLQQHSRDTEVYTNLANGTSVTVLSSQTFYAQDVTDNGDGTLTVRFTAAGNQVMYDEDGTVIARLFSGSFVVEATFDHGGTPTDPNDDEPVAFNFLRSSGLRGDFCEALVPAIT